MLNLHPAAEDLMSEKTQTTRTVPDKKARIATLEQLLRGPILKEAMGAGVTFSLDPDHCLLVSNVDGSVDRYSESSGTWGQGNPNAAQGRFAIGYGNFETRFGLSREPAFYLTVIGTDKILPGQRPDPALRKWDDVFNDPQEIAARVLTRHQSNEAEAMASRNAARKNSFLFNIGQALQSAFARNA